MAKPESELSGLVIAQQFLFWGAHAPRVQAVASSRSRTFRLKDQFMSLPKGFGEGAETCTRGACAPPE
jgi:hypothetical protein